MQNEKMSQMQKQLDHVKDPQQNEKIQQLEQQILMLQKEKTEIDEEFDPETEYEEIKQMFDLYRNDTKATDLSYLYASCYYTKD